MTKDELKQLSTNVVAVADRAARVILSSYKKNSLINAKDDGSPVTEADHASHEALVRGLSRLLPVPVISEEGDLTIEHGDLFWLIDPLDGTKGFIKENDEFTINIALMKDLKPILGVLHHPVMDQVFWGYEDVAFERKNGEVHPLKMASYSPHRLVMGRSTDGLSSGEKEDFLKNYSIGSTDYLGSALKFGLLARGDYDLYVRFAASCEWDVAAGHAIIRGAGGQMTNLDGTPFIYGKKDFLNPGFVVSINE